MHMPLWYCPPPPQPLGTPPPLCSHATGGGVRNCTELPRPRSLNHINNDARVDLSAFLAALNIGL